MADERVSAEPQPEVVAAPPVAAPVAPTTTFGGGGGAGSSVAASLRSGTMSPDGVLALQRMAGNQAIASVLARDTPAAAPAAPAPAPQASVSPAFTLEVPESATDALKLEVGKASYVKGSANIKGEVQFVPVPTGTEASNNTVGTSTGSGGAKVEVEVEAQKELAAFLKSLGFEKVEEMLTFEAGIKKLEISLGVSAKAKTKWDWCKGLLEGKIIGVGIEWEKITEASFGAVELAGGFTGEGKVTLGGIDYIAKPKIVLAAKAEINWAKVAAKAAEEGIKQGAKEGTKAAVQTVGTEAGVTALAVDGAAVGSAVAAIAIPVAAAVAMGYGAYQAMRNAESAMAGASKGVELRDKANLWAKNYARTMTGHRGEGPGADEAEAQIAAIMAQTHAPREFVVALIRDQRGGYDKLREEALGLIKPKMFDDAAKAYDEGHEKNFTMIDSIGPEWGSRGVFRKQLRLVLMSDTAVGGG
jgi:hypothetical protein